MAGALRRRERDEDTEETQGKGHVMTETETRVMRPPAEAPTEAGQDEEGCAPRAFAGSGTLPTPWLWTSGLRSCERRQFCHWRPRPAALQG